MSKNVIQDQPKFKNLWERLKRENKREIEPHPFWSKVIPKLSPEILFFSLLVFVALFALEPDLRSLYFVDGPGGEIAFNAGIAAMLYGSAHLFLRRRIGPVEMAFLGIGWAFFNIAVVLAYAGAAEPAGLFEEALLLLQVVYALVIFLFARAGAFVYAGIEYDEKVWHILLGIVVAAVAVFYGVFIADYHWASTFALSLFATTVTFSYLVK